ncbi:hypothetical protein HMPREF1978_00229 [Actinomyces graevenitzii F0530]|uniref:Uncharacterized protein n=1 Tax=Actinomyces graevenitzii F0530 TaxID=1321817 RepID=U1RJC1_9ACTO|nr:hypothetical protein HMPREF1978_00229 [Actinomyces graevenitzii F0530]
MPSGSCLSGRAWAEKRHQATKQQGSKLKQHPLWRLLATAYRQNQSGK